VRRATGRDRSTRVATGPLAGVRARVVGAVVACAVASNALAAQSINFVLSTAPIVFPTPTLANFSSWPPSAVGPVTDSVALPFTVDRTGNVQRRETTVLVRCTAVSGGKACADIEWRNGASGPWTALTVTDAVVESRTVIPNELNDPWSGTLWLRVRIDWDDPAPSVMTSGIALTLSVYRP